MKRRKTIKTRKNKRSESSERERTNQNVIKVTVVRMTTR